MSQVCYGSINVVPKIETCSSIAAPSAAWDLKKRMSPAVVICSRDLLTKSAVFLGLLPYFTRLDGAFYAIVLFHSNSKFH